METGVQPTATREANKMRKRRSFRVLLVPTLLLLLCAFALALASCGDSGGDQSAPDGSSDYVPGQLIVKFKAEVAPDQVEGIIKESGGESVIETIGSETETRTYLIELQPGVAVEEAVEDFESREDVEYAEPNTIYRIQ
jgi:thermitase